MFFRLFILFVTVPLVELALLLYIGSKLGWLQTFLLVVITGLAGAWLAQRQGVAALGRIRHDLAQGRMPTDAVLDAALIFFAGVLLMTPGVMTDAIGMVLLIPWGRLLVKAWLFQWFKRKFNISAWPPGGSRPAPGAGVVIDASPSPHVPGQTATGETAPGETAPREPH